MSLHEFSYCTSSLLIDLSGNNERGVAFFFPNHTSVVVVRMPLLQFSRLDELVSLSHGNICAALNSNALPRDALKPIQKWLLRCLHVCNLFAGMSF